MATQEEKVVHYARLWYETERSAMKAPVGMKNKADNLHTKAKQELRDAVCRLPGVEDEVPNESGP